MIELHDKVTTETGKEGEAVIIACDHALVRWQDGSETWVNLARLVKLANVQDTGTEAMF